MRITYAAMSALLFCLVNLSAGKGHSAEEGTPAAASFEEASNSVPQKNAQAGEEDGLPKFLKVGGSGNPEAQATVEELMELAARLDEAGPEKPSASMPSKETRTKILVMEETGLGSGAGAGADIAETAQTPEKEAKAQAAAGPPETE